MTFDTVIRGGQVALPGRDPVPANVAISGGRIAAITDVDTELAATETVDASGLLVMPGVLDVHLHLGHGSDISRPRVAADAAGETAAAVAGGVTTIIPYLMSTDPFSEVFEDVRTVTEAGARIDFGYHFIISTEAQLAEVPRYVSEFGAPSFKIFMNNRGGEGKRLGLPDIDDGFLLRLCQLSAANGGMVCPHAESIEAAWVTRDAAMKADPEGTGSLATWNNSRPPFVEAEAVQRAAAFARATGAPLYVVHTTSAEALDAARLARSQNTNIIIETCPHYLTHDVEWEGRDIGKINPPLREAADREALWEGIRDGFIDTVGTDHIHRGIEAKQGGIWKASPGCPGLETLLPVMLSEGYHRRNIPIRRIVSLLCEAPARHMGLAGRKGVIAPGADADLVLVDLEATHRISNAATHSSAAYSIYDGWEMKGKPLHTFSRGRAVFRDGALVDDAIGTGRYLHRRLGAA